jgi:hypothetical protein
MSDKESQDKVKENNYYFNILDPDTGERYDIPMLSTMDPEYYWKYIDMMKTKQYSPDTFERVLNWD